MFWALGGRRFGMPELLRLVFDTTVIRGRGGCGSESRIKIRSKGWTRSAGRSTQRRLKTRRCRFGDARR